MIQFGDRLMRARKRRHHPGWLPGSVYQRADGRWVASVRLPSGKRVVRHGKSQADINRVLQELRKHEIQGSVAPLSTLTVTEWFDQWMEGIDVRPSARRIYSNTTTVRPVGARPWNNS